MDTRNNLPTNNNAIKIHKLKNKFMSYPSVLIPDYQEVSQTRLQVQEG